MTATPDNTSASDQANPTVRPTPNPERQPMSITPAKLDDFDWHREHLALSDSIETLRMDGDYTQLEEARRQLRWLLDELKLLYDNCEQAVVSTLPREGAVIDGLNTVAKSGSVTRKFDKDKIVRKVVAEALGEMEISAEVGDVVAAILQVFPLSEPRMKALVDHNIFWKDYVLEERTGRARIVVQGEAA